MFIKAAKEVALLNTQATYESDSERLEVSLVHVIQMGRKVVDAHPNMPKTCTLICKQKTHKHKNMTEQWVYNETGYEVRIKIIGSLEMRQSDRFVPLASAECAHSKHGQHCSLQLG